MDCECDERAKDNMRGVVREEYGKIARQDGSCCGPSSCCGGPSADLVAAAVGYNGEDIADLPEGANMGLSCGNPTALASLRPGEVVLDLGSGGGFDVFIAARKIGPSGRAIGVDMTADMVAKARRNAESFRKSTGLDNVEFRLGEIEHLPVADASVNVVISNCVINLSPDKPQVWQEIARVLKPGGRVAVSDLALLCPLPKEVRASVEALVGCIAGAALAEETRKMVHAAGLVENVFETKSDYIDQMSQWSDPLYKEIASRLPPGRKPSDYVTSLNVTAYKCSPHRAESNKEKGDIMKEQNDELKQTTETCGPGCSCGTTGGGSRMKWVICGVVALAAVVVVAAHVSRTRAAVTPKQDYAAVVPVVAAIDAAKLATDASGWGTPLKSLAELNQVAADTEAVFVVLPSKDSTRMDEIRKEVSAAAATIRSRGTRMGTFLLSEDAREYAVLAQQVGSPAVLAMYKGRGMAAVSDKQVAQESLLKAFVGSSRPVSGCCPGGAGASGCQ